MLVANLQPGMLLETDQYLRYFLQDSKIDFPRLRIAPSVIASMVSDVEIDSEQQPFMYLGESAYSLGKSKKRKLRTVMVEGVVAYVEGRDFRLLEPISSEFFEGDI